MYHRLQFLVNHQLDLQMPKKARLEQLIVKQGEIIEARVRPYVQETQEGPVEMADLELPGDGTLLAVRMELFCFA
ncbi:hypothetical protein AYO44_13195 [Planctomycetaceae bacterium SCGC AG-212-F19]|nr:hypothetical protein AYO44_13195 [Planctomycetaceae bacterium SCGC AG-212-F19]